MLSRIKGFQEKYKAVTPSWCQNKYFYISAVFLFWIAFFDKNGIRTHVALGMTEYNLKRDKERLKDSIVVMKQARVNLEVNKERIAREKYYLHKPNEEVFIISKK
jgi:cell division protein DivIC